MKTKIIAIAAVIVVLLIGGWWFLQNKFWGNQFANFGNPKGSATQAVYFTPVMPGGQQQAGDCFASSIAAPRKDAWRCTVGEQIYDPCFTAAHLDTVVCGADPLSGIAGFALLLKRPLPAPTQLTQAPPAWGWLLQLSDGTICAPFTGTRAQINGKTTTYGCKSASNNNNVVILGDLNSSKTLWTAQVATISFADNQVKADKVETLSVTKVWQ